MYRCWQFFDGIGLKEESDPVGAVRRIALILAGADTHTSALAWMEIPIIELMDWIQSAQALASEREKKSRK